MYLLSALLPFCLSAFLADPLEDSRLIRVKSDVVFAEPNAEVVCSIGEVYTSNSYRFEITLKNESGETFEATDIRASCGCVAGLTSQVKIPSNESGLLVAVMTVPDTVGDFEKIVYLKNVTGQELTLRLRGTSKPRIILTHGNLLVPEYAKQPVGIYLEAKSDCNEVLSDLVWTVESSLPIQVDCQMKSGESGVWTINFHSEIDSTIKDSSIMAYLTCSSTNGLVLAKKEFQLHLGYNASTTPRRLILKKSDGIYKGVLMVRKAHFLDDGINEGDKKVELQSGDDFKKRIELVGAVQRLRNGSFVLKFDCDQQLIDQESLQRDGRLCLDLVNRDFYVPVVFQ